MAVDGLDEPSVEADEERKLVMTEVKALLAVEAMRVTVEDEVVVLVVGNVVNVVLLELDGLLGLDEDDVVDDAADQMESEFEAEVRELVEYD
jgi:hypothetical protein